MDTQTTVNPAEVAKFEAMAAEWWNPQGKFKPLHMLNPCRLDYITGQIAAEFGRDLSAPQPFAGLRILDIGAVGVSCLNRWRGLAQMWWVRMPRHATSRWRNFMLNSRD